MSTKQVRAQYTQEFKLEAVRQVRSEQTITVVAKVLGIPKASLGNWVRQTAKGVNADTRTYIAESACREDAAGSAAADDQLRALGVHQCSGTGYSIALPISSTTFLASPNTIMVLSM